MSSVLFLHFPLSIQHQIVTNMNPRELVKFSFCSKRTVRAVKSSEITMPLLVGSLLDRRTEVNLCGHYDSYLVTFFPYSSNAEECKIGPKYLGFEGLIMYDYTEVAGEDTYHTGVVFLPEGQDFQEASDRLIGYLKSLFVDVTFQQWDLDPLPARNMVILRKYFWRMEALYITSRDPQNPRNQRLLSLQDIDFLMEQFQVTNYLWISSEVEEGFFYSRGFQAPNIYIKNPSWVHWDAILNSTSRCITLHDVRTLSSSDLNKLLKLWVSMEKMDGLVQLEVALEFIDGLEFTPDFIEFVLEGIRNYEIDEVWDSTPGQSMMQRKISRFDGRMATVKVDRNYFSFQVNQ